MKTIEVQISDNPTAEDSAAIVQNLCAFNESQTGPAGVRELAAIARRDDSQLAGGLLAFTHWGWLHVRFLWVAEPMRGQGLGSRLLKAAEDEARARGCGNAHLDTFSFQALPFYERFGYAVFGQLENYPTGFTRFFLQKSLTGG